MNPPTTLLVFDTTFVKRAVMPPLFLFSGKFPGFAGVTISVIGCQCKLWNTDSGLTFNVFNERDCF